MINRKETVRYFYAWVNYFIIFLIAFYSFQFVCSFMVSPLFELGMRLDLAIAIFNAINLTASGLLSFFIYKWSVNKFIQPQILASAEIDEEE